MIDAIIFILIFILFYTYIGYPLLLRVLNHFFADPVKSDRSFQPEIAIVISAYNEEEYIEDTINSIFKCEYPEDKLRVFIGSDGSSDKTLEICYKLQEKHPNLNVFDYPRAGKNLTLNKLVPKTTADYIFLMDADCRLKKGILQKMVSYFADDSVGIVLGSAVHIAKKEDEDDTGRLGDTFYHKYERNIRILESNIFSTVNSFGPFYAITRDCYEPIPNNRVCDDYYPILKTIQKDKRVIFCKDDHIYEVREKSLMDEFNRRLRSTTCGMASVWLEKRIFSPRYKWASLFLISHKIFRWLNPFLLILLALLTLMLADGEYLKLPLVLCKQHYIYLLS